MLAGRPGLGLVCLFGYWLWLGVWVCVGAGTLGLGLVAIPMWWLVAMISALQSAQRSNTLLLLRLVRSAPMRTGGTQG